MEGIKAKMISGTILSSEEMNSHNTFENPNNLVPADFKGAKIKGNSIVLTIPAISVVVLSL
jgi:alpha-N-arabinofuranosidase